MTPPSAPADSNAAALDETPNNTTDEWLARNVVTHAAIRPGVARPPESVLLSVVIPAFNERRWIREVIRRVQDVSVPKEIIIVDDYSTDGTREILQQLNEPGVRVIFHERNQGKGAALRTGFAQASGDLILVQDADLEYDPADYPRLLRPILDGRADVVFGSRFIGETHRVPYFRHYIANFVLTTLSNIFTSLSLTDMETCYKVFRREVVENVQLKSNRFGFEPEITAKVARGRWRVYEVAVSYSGRTYEEGKKIGFKDALNALYCIVRFSVAD
jgi:glycosyltransferase involved in cell wall biosynthesis